MTDYKIITDREEILKAIKYNPDKLAIASETLRDDREVVFNAVKDTIKIRFKIEAVIYENSLEIQDQSTYYLDSEGNENPLNYTNFLELFQMLDNSI